MDLYCSCSRLRLKLSPCDRLVSQPPAQIVLRTVPVPLQAFKWLIIPMLNPDGVARGCYRCSWGLSVQVPQRDMQQMALQQVWLVQISTVTAMQSFSVLVRGKSLNSKLLITLGVKSPRRVSQAEQKNPSRNLSLERSHEASSRWCGDLYRILSFNGFLSSAS